MIESDTIRTTSIRWGLAALAGVLVYEAGVQGHLVDLVAAVHMAVRRLEKDDSEPTIDAAVKAVAALQAALKGTS